MNKTLLIIRREYLTRVRKRSFILATLLTPIGMALFFVVVGFIFAYDSDEAKRIVVLDEAGVVTGGIKDESAIKFDLARGGDDLEGLKDRVRAGDFDAVLRIPPIPDVYTGEVDLYFYTDDNLSIDLERVVKSRTRDYIRSYKAAQLGLDERSLDALSFDLTVEPEPIDDTESEASSMTSVVAAGIGTAMGFVMYITIFVYGMMVMRSVQEEKTTRIVEVMISSVKPFQLMLGKIVGVALVGFTQVVTWIVLIPLLVGGASLVFGFDAAAAGADPTAGGAIDPAEAENTVALVLAEIERLNWWAIVPLFLLYFLGGYFLYASMFAAVGSAVGEDLGESNSLTVPISIPVALAVYIAMAAVDSPFSSLAVWSSQFPLFSPIVMPVRLAFEPPVWEVALSVTILVATAVFFVWLSARIYRTGILLYGKKVGFKELGKWMVRG